MTRETRQPFLKTNRYSYIDTVGSGKLLDWKFRPLQEIQIADNITKLYHTRANAGIRYSFFKGISADLKYQYERSQNNNLNLQDQDSYFVRNLINLYSQVTAGTIKRNIPLGAILDKNISELSGHSGRAQLNINQSFSSRHNITAIAGVEIREVNSNSSLSRLYGYDPATLSSTPVDYVTQFPQYQSLANARLIPVNTSATALIDVFKSYFSNAAYTYNNRYTFSASGRIDQSNLFGAATNHKSVPLWSIGSSWLISDEQFYDLSMLPYLKFRATFGYNGNIDKTVTALVTQRYSTTVTDVGLAYANIANAPNPELRWEKSAMFNIGFDFEFFKGIANGSIEYFTKKGTDLIGNAPIAPSTGFTTFKGNVANMKGQGVDIVLSTHNLRTAKLNWSSNLLFSYAADKVTSYNVKFSDFVMAQSGDGAGSSTTVFPLTGRPVYSIYSFKWAGLDATGDPQGYVNGQVSKDYTTTKK